MIMRKAMTTFVRSSGQNSAVQSVLTSNKAYVGLSDTATEVLDLFPCSLVVVCILGHCWVEGYNWMYSSHHVKPYLFCLYNGISSDMTVPIGKKNSSKFHICKFLPFGLLISFKGHLHLGGRVGLERLRQLDQQPTDRLCH